MRVFLQRFFKTGAGQYGEGDRFIGVRVPDMRRVCREGSGASLATIRSLLRSPVHEERALALLLLVQAFQKADDKGRRTIYEAYLAHTRDINNWDLVDASAGPIVGGWLAERSRAPLSRLARSTSLWERRIAIVATHHFIRRGELDETFRIADLLIRDTRRPDPQGRRVDAARGGEARRCRAPGLPAWSAIAACPARCCGTPSSDFLKWSAVGISRDSSSRMQRLNQ